MGLVLPSAHCCVLNALQHPLPTRVKCPCPALPYVGAFSFVFEAGPGCLELETCWRWQASVLPLPCQNCPCLEQGGAEPACGAGPFQCNPATVCSGRLGGLRWVCRNWGDFQAERSVPQAGAFAVSLASISPVLVLSKHGLMPPADSFCI